MSFPSTSVNRDHLYRLLRLALAYQPIIKKWIVMKTLLFQGGNADFGIFWQWLRPSDTAGRRSGRTVSRIWTRWWTRLRGVEHAQTTGELTSPGRSNMESIKWNLDLRSQTLKHQSNVVNAHTKNIQQLPFGEYFCHLCVAKFVDRYDFLFTSSWWWDSRVTWPW